MKDVLTEDVSANKILTVVSSVKAKRWKLYFQWMRRSRGEMKDETGA